MAVPEASISLGHARSLTKIKETRRCLRRKSGAATFDQAEVALPRAIGILMVKSAPPDNWFSANISVVCFDNGADNRKSHAQALRLGAEERVEDVLEIIVRDTGIGVANPDFSKIAGASGCDDDFSLPDVCSGYRVPVRLNVDPLDFTAVIRHFHFVHAGKFPRNGVVIDHL
jgi:hypothetical protein